MLSISRAVAVECRITERDRILIRYEFASGQWSGDVEPFDDRTGRFGEPRELGAEQVERLRRFFEFVLGSEDATAERRGSCHP